MDWTSLIFWEVVLAGTLRLATPLLFAALGEMLTERAGLLNLGINGTMTAGAFVAVLASSLAGWGAGLLAAAAVGALFGLMLAWPVIRAGADQIVTGIAIAFIGGGLTNYLFTLWQPSGQSVAFVPLVPTLEIPVLSDLPLLGPVLFSHTLLTYGGIALMGGLWWMMTGTRLGLRLRAVGDDPEGARAQGIDPDRLRILATVAGGALMGLGGAAITIGFLGSFSTGVVAGRGFVALAIVIIGRWTPLGAFLGAALFAFFDSLSLRAQGGAGLPTEVYSMLPYLATFAVLVLAARGGRAPRALGKMS